MDIHSLPILTPTAQSSLAGAVMALPVISFGLGGPLYHPIPVMASTPEMFVYSYRRLRKTDLKRLLGAVFIMSVDPVPLTRELVCYEGSNLVFRLNSLIVGPYLNSDL